MKTKSHRLALDVHLGLDDYELIPTQVQDILEPPMTAIVTAHNSMKSALDMHIVRFEDTHGDPTSQEWT